MRDILFDFISKYISLTEDEKNAIAITHRAYHTKLPDGFNSWMINGLNSSSENQDFILVLIFS